MSKWIQISIFTLMLAGCSAPPVSSTFTPNPTVTPTVPRPLTSTPVPSLTPTPTSTATPYPLVAPRLAAGDYHTCFLSPSGRVSCWGWNQFGQAGEKPGTENTLPGTFLDLQGIMQLSAGAYHTCAVDAEHQVYCWGRNNMGQLGDGTYKDTDIPVQVIGLEGANITNVASGSFHTCAYEAGGRAWCWGSNRDGKLGTGSSEMTSSTPARIPKPVANVISISAGASFTCAAGDDGENWCWGDGMFGQTGGRLMKSSATPQETENNIPGIIQLSSGWFHTCALTDSGYITCWGKNYEGALGNSSTVSRGLAANVTGISGKKEVRLLAAGGRSACAVIASGQLYCWGKNDYGQAGIGNTSDVLLPFEVTTLTGKHVISLAIGASHVCALTDATELFCWGANDHYQLGVDTPDMSLSPLLIILPVK